MQSADICRPHGEVVQLTFIYLFLLKSAVEEEEHLQKVSTARQQTMSLCLMSHSKWLTVKPNKVTALAPATGSVGSGLGSQKQTKLQNFRGPEKEKQLVNKENIENRLPINTSNNNFTFLYILTLMRFRAVVFLSFVQSQACCFPLLSVCILN